MAKPNVIFIIMDDLCYGDLACHGNPYTRTPNLDRMYAESTRLTRYNTGPLCSPARACVMTGRYHQRTRVLDTYCGRSMIDPEEITLGKQFKSGGYHTGAFGKWHLGDCYPMRAMDLGFDETLMHNGGGIGQPGDHYENHYRECNGEESYFDPVLFKNGVPVKTSGYCTDVFTDAALDFIEHHKDGPFFVYLATNAPHSPLEIADEWADTYRNMGINDVHSRLYGMVENIDMNVGRLLDKLDELKLSEDTIVVYTSDHGPCSSARNLEAPEDQWDRFNAGLRGIKGTMYQGGIKVPCFWRWPGKFKAGRDIDRVTHPIDVMPTLLDACGVSLLPETELDGRDLTPLLFGEQAEEAFRDWPDRYIFMQWHRGDIPVPYRNYAVINQQYKLYRPEEGQTDELYDLMKDPFEKRDLASEFPEVVEEMRHLYDEWLNDVATTRGQGTFDNPLIHVGTPYENPTVLTQNDWRLFPNQEGWLQDHFRGSWDVYVAESGKFDVTLRFRPDIPSGTAFFKADGLQIKTRIENGVLSCDFENVELNKGQLKIEAWVQTEDSVSTARYQHFISARYVEMSRKE